jgi:DNA-directed RNA polymerase specialized sigma24 family protein
MVKEAQRTPLDDAFDQFWNHSSSRQPADDLLAAVRTFTLRATGYDEDTAQLVCMFVFQGLERFRRADPTAFTRWVRTIIRRTRLKTFPISSIHTKMFDEGSLPLHDEAEYLDLSQLPDSIRHVANELLAGYSLTEIAEQQNITGAALRNKLMRFRRSALPKNRTD